MSSTTINDAQAAKLRELNLPKPSVSIAAEMVSRHQHRDVRIDVIEGLTVAAKTAADACHTARDAATTILRDPMQTPLANRRDAAKAVEKHLARATRSIDTMRPKALAVIAELEAAMAPKPSPLAPEIRTRLAALTKDQRQKILSGPVDEATVFAILSAPAWISGMTPEQVAVTRSLFERKRHPEKLDQRDRVRSAVEEIEKLGGRVVSYLSALVDVAGLEEAEAAAAAARAAAEA